ncbi:SDR family oxidoreductase [Pseudoxanthomonas sp. PXM02]|uniref:SDR family oxidoreductase n=1 Tax=Pseudoxanthomonas sp. PXM02 TaxID=2769294 RepID=UPI00177C9F61|nr:SDR family oxidoreductase [Pseudoxanthomonas sp. PXM02]MBD9479142.1 SDR family oxidoreductase [Pseudoxanthomonas sp. PXM02]
MDGATLRAVRQKGRPLADDERACDLGKMLRAEDWVPLLDGVDAVVNAAGILREEKGQTFEAIHVAAPLALAHACVARDVGRFVQVSALGLPEDGPFIASKHRFDEQLGDLPLSSVVLRPSVVYSVSGSYGGTSLLRALAGFPGMQWLPGDGRWQVQPLAAEDLGELVARAVGGAMTGTYEVGGPAPLSLRDYQSQWRRWLRAPGGHVAAVPEACVSLAVSVMEWLGRGPVGRTMWRMLQRGNITTVDAADRLQADFGLRPRSLPEALRQAPSQVQDRWHAQLYFLAPVLKWSVVVLWLLSAVAGFVTPATDILEMSASTPLEACNPVLLARGGGIADLLLGLWLASGWRPRAAVAAMLLMLLGYTLLLGSLVPALWWDPLGGLAKNLVLLPALAMLWVLTERR